MAEPVCAVVMLHRQGGRAARYKVIATTAPPEKWRRCTAARPTFRLTVRRSRRLDRHGRWEAAHQESPRTLVPDSSGRSSMSDPDPSPPILLAPQRADVDLDGRCGSAASFSPQTWSRRPCLPTVAPAMRHEVSQHGELAQSQVQHAAVSSVQAWRAGSSASPPFLSTAGSRAGPRRSSGPQVRRAAPGDVNGPTITSSRRAAPVQARARDQPGRRAPSASAPAGRRPAARSSSTRHAADPEQHQVQDHRVVAENSRARCSPSMPSLATSTA